MTDGLPHGPTSRYARGVSSSRSHPVEQPSVLLLRRIGALACPTDPSHGLVIGDDGVVRCEAGGVLAWHDGVLDAMGGDRPHLTLAQLSNLVPLTARIYERYWRVRSLGLLSGRPFPIEEELVELETAVGDVAGGLVVDVAASEGLYGRRLAARGADVITIDHSAPFARRTRDRAEAELVADRVLPVRARAQRLPVRSGVADAAVMGGSLNEIGDMEGALAEMARVVRPGGRLFTMSLVRASTGPGRVLQAALGPSGIVFPTLERTRAAFPAGVRIVEERLDGVVLRLTAEVGPRS
jgi:ubiquinone/menaquinone biosynthesis C-methylase UbiE